MKLLVERLLKRLKIPRIDSFGQIIDRSKEGTILVRKVLPKLDEYYGIGPWEIHNDVTPR